MPARPHPAPPRATAVRPERRATVPGRLLVLTDRRMAQAAGHTVVDVVSRAISGARSVADQRIGHPEPGARPPAVAVAMAVVLRDKDLPPGERAVLARHVRAATAPAGVALVVAGDPELAASVGADGVHLAADDPWPDAACLARLDAAAGAAVGGRAIGRGAVVGRSCHTPAEVRAAAAEGAAYVTYSPVFATPSKPGYGPAVGLDGLSEAVDAAGGMAVVALGGIGPSRVEPCLAVGAYGAAVMGEVMRAGDPAAVVRALVAAQGVGGRGGAGG